MVEGWVVDVEWLFYDDDIFDVVFGYVVIYYIFDVELVFCEMLWVLKFGGWFVIVGEFIMIGNWYVCWFGWFMWELMICLMYLLLLCDKWFWL